MSKFAPNTSEEAARLTPELAAWMREILADDEKAVEDETARLLNLPPVAELCAYATGREMQALASCAQRVAILHVVEANAKAFRAEHGGGNER